MRALTGKPGAGKSYGALLLILEELERGDKYIVTNMALLLPMLNEYYQRGGRRFIDVYERIRLISREEAGEFWRFRGTFSMRKPPKVLTRGRDIKKLKIGAGAVISDDDLEESYNVVDALSWYVLPGMPGVLYVIDEAHILFDARNFQRTAKELTVYNSQHRKFVDDVIFVTQFLDLLEKRIRGFCEIFIVYKNFAGNKMWNILSMPRRMRELTYSVDPTGAGRAAADTEVWRQLDISKASLYDTMAGVGVQGGRKPEVRKQRGFSIPWWAVLIGIPCLCWGVSAAFDAAANKVATNLKVSVDPHEKRPIPSPYPPPQTPSVSNRPSGAPPAPAPVVVSEPRRVGSVSVDSPPAAVVASLVTADRVLVVLDDGRILRAPQIAVIDSDKVVTRDGAVHWMQRAKRGSVVQANSAQRPATVPPERAFKAPTQTPAIVPAQSAGGRGLLGPIDEQRKPAERRSIASGGGHAAR